MKAKSSQHHTTIGIDLGDKKHAVCVLDKRGDILREFSIANESKALAQLAADYPKARVGMETGTHSPWISRLLQSAGLEVIVANARKLRAIYTSERKSDVNDARTLARIARLDPQLLHPVSHRSEGAQRDLLLIKLRDSLVRQRVAVINSVRASLKSLGVKLPLKNSAASLQRARQQLAQSQAEL
ncbi:MAG: transposase, partial [Prosthecobacter sp.]|nr:transposase [Prosthecobacter sp.]